MGTDYWLTISLVFWIIAADLATTSKLDKPKTKRPVTRRVSVQSKAPSRQAIEVRAYEIFLGRGAVPGHEVEDWLQAEAELNRKASRN